MLLCFYISVVGLFNVGTFIAFAFEGNVHMIALTDQTSLLGKNFHQNNQHTYISEQS